MGTQITLTLIFVIGIAGLLVFNEFIYRRLSLKGEITRKIAHFTATLSTLIFPYIFDSHWNVLALGLFFFIILFASSKGTQLKSIHDVRRVSHGSYLLPVSIYLTFLIAHLADNMFLFILPIMILAICDPMAGILGLNFKRRTRNIRLMGHDFGKTVLGSAAFFISSFIISLIALYYIRMKFDLNIFLLALGIAAVSTLTELISVKGLDNLTIPMSVILMLVLFH